MTKTHYSLGTVMAIVLAVLVATGFFTSHNPLMGSDEQAVRMAVTQFGSKLKLVSLLAPDASAQIATQYGPYVTPSLIYMWQASPEHALGRQTSSPWPERIEVSSVAVNSDRATAQGTIVEATSGNPQAASYRADFVLEKQGSAWLIAAVHTSHDQEAPPQPSAR